MLRRLSRISLALAVLISSQVWALGLGDIQLDSALNEPLRAEISLLSATPEELSNLNVAMADAATFDSYGLDRPVYLQDIEFMIINGVIEVRSRSPITEPFITFLVDATWSRGRLLREYTVLLDPPTFAPQTRTEPAVTAPQRSTPADSGRINREPTPPAPRAQSNTAPAPTRAPARSDPEPQREPAAESASTSVPESASSPVPESASLPVPESASSSVPESASSPVPEIASSPVPEIAYDTSDGSNVVAQRGQTLWGITRQVMPDSRLTMNQTMLAIFEANPDAFSGNINKLRAGASLRIPSADEVFQIGRGDALSEVQRQHAEWDGSPYVAPRADPEPQPSLQLVPPDDDLVLDGAGDDLTADADSDFGSTPSSMGDEAEQRINEIDQRINALESANVPEQRSLIEIRDNELAALRYERARLRGEAYEPVEDVVAADDVAADDAAVDPFEDADTTASDDVVADEQSDEVAEPAPEPNVVTTRTASKPSLVDRALAILTSKWTMIGGGLLVAIALLIGFMRRRRDDDDESGAWQQDLDEDEMSGDDLMSATETIRAPARDEESFVVVEQDSAIRPLGYDTIEVPAIAEATDASGISGSLEDTFSSETAINLDEPDLIAEADFHMAYGLYDQAADLINGALEVEPENQDLLTKLCEIYFVWGNPDAFVDAAGRLKAAIGGDESSDWDKIVIMGQQITADHELFEGAGVAGATRAVDLSFDAEDMDEPGALDMDLGAEPDASHDVIDLGMDETVSAADDDGIDFLFDGDDTVAATTEDSADNSVVDFDLTVSRETASIDLENIEATAEMPIAEMPAADLDDTVEGPSDSPTIEQQFDVLGGTVELPSLDLADVDVAGGTAESSSQSPDETAEINLDDLGLDISGLDETELASLDDFDVTSESEALSTTGINEALEDPTGVMGRDLEIDTDSSGARQRLSEEDAAKTEALVDMGLDEVTGTNTLLNLDAGSVAESTDAGIDESLLDATGLTQVLSEDFAVETTADVEADLAKMLSDADATMLAPGYGDDDAVDAPADDDATMLAGLDDEDDFDFGKTGAPPADVFTSNISLDETSELPAVASLDETSELAAVASLDETSELSAIASLDETSELPAIASTDFDLDLDDLTAALKVSEMGDTVDQPRDDATVEQPRPDIAGADDSAETLVLAPGDLSEDLHDARTMTEVGTKLDLARAYVDMGDPAGARSILEEVLDEGDDGQRQQAQQLLDSLT